MGNPAGSNQDPTSGEDLIECVWSGADVAEYAWPGWLDRRLKSFSLLERQRS